MAKIIEAIYENGVFKPLEKVDLKEGERVRIEIKESLADIIEKYSRRVDKDVLKEFLDERR
ncbi:MAG: antitoxin family protein [Candidatus Aenigmatarchaeota archaeon]